MNLRFCLNMCVKLEMGGDMNTLTTMLEELRKEF